jgi:hypothetical protein
MSYSLEQLAELFDECKCALERIADVLERAEAREIAKELMQSQQSFPPVPYKPWQQPWQRAIADDLRK